MTSFGWLFLSWGGSGDLWAWQDPEAPDPPSTPAVESQAWSPRGSWEGGLGGLAVEEPGRGLGGRGTPPLMSVADLCCLLQALPFPQCPGKPDREEERSAL